MNCCVAIGLGLGLSGLGCNKVFFVTTGLVACRLSSVLRHDPLCRDSGGYKVELKFIATGANHLALRPSLVV